MLCGCSLRYVDIEKAEPSEKLALLSYYSSFPGHASSPTPCIPAFVVPSAPAAGASQYYSIWTSSPHEYKINKTHFFISTQLQVF